MRAEWVVSIVKNDIDKSCRGSFDFDNMTVMRVAGVVLILIPNMSRCDFNLR
jgi:hypothetical protein